MMIIRPPSLADLTHVAAHMREVDALECLVMGGKDPMGGLLEAVEVSDWAFAVEVENEPVAVFGVSSDGLLSDEGVPWLLGTNRLTGRTLLLGTQPYLNRMREEYQTLANYVHADNCRAIRYLKWCGFSFGEAVDVRGHPFLPFSMDCRVDVRAAA